MNRPPIPDAAQVALCAHLLAHPSSPWEVQSLSGDWFPPIDPILSPWDFLVQGTPFRMRPDALVLPTELEWEVNEACTLLILHLPTRTLHCSVQYVSITDESVEFFHDGKKHILYTKTNAINPPIS